MATIDVPSREDLHDEFISDYSGAQPTKNTSRGSDPYRLGRVVSGFLWSCLARLLNFDKQRLPDTAEKENLERWGNTYDFPRQLPAGSSATEALAVTTTGAAVFAGGEELTHADGTRYKIAKAYNLGGAGTYNLDVAAISTGEQTNKVIGEVLTFSAPPTNVNAAATLVKGLTKGLDKEEDDQYRDRLLAHIGDPPEGGSIHDYIEWLRKVPGVASAYVWRFRRGMGTLDLAVLGAGSGAARILADLDPVRTAISAVRPGNVKDFVVLELAASPQPVTVRIAIDETAYKWDWDDGGADTYQISARNQGASTITVAAPGTVITGKRLTVKGEEATVIGRSGNVLTLQFASPATWFTFDPLSEYIRTSGDLVTPTRDAIIALFDRLGPARDTRYAATEWEADLLTDSIITACRNVKGVKKVVVDLPAADVTATDPLNGAITGIPFLTPGTVKVLRKVS